MCLRGGAQPPSTQNMFGVRMDLIATVAYPSSNWGVYMHCSYSWRYSNFKVRLLLLPLYTCTIGQVYVITSINCKDAPNDGCNHCAAILCLNMRLCVRGSKLNQSWRCLPPFLTIWRESYFPAAKSSLSCRRAQESGSNLVIQKSNVIGDNFILNLI